MAMSLEELEKFGQIEKIHAHTFHLVKKKSYKFLAMSCKKFTNEHLFLWSNWTKVHEIITRYRGIIYAVNTHIEVAISNSFSECRAISARG